MSTKKFARSVEKVEGFQIIAEESSKFSYKRQANGDQTVAQWRSARGNETVNVLWSGGCIAGGNARLKNVRQSYV